MTILERGHQSISQRITSSLAAARALLAAPPAAPPRIRAAVEHYEAESAQIASATLLAGVLMFAALYAATYSNFAVHHAVEPAPVALAFYGAFTALRLATGRLRRRAGAINYVSAAIDIAALYALIASFPFQYEAPAALYLKAPTLSYVFIIIALRSLWFDPRLILFTGGMAAFGWGALALLAAIGGAPLTGDYRVYMTSLSLLPGAELEKIAAIVATTVVLAIGVHRARSLLYRTAAGETIAADLSKFVGRDAAARIRASRDGIKAGDGEVRRAAVMVVDLRGFTAATRGLPPREVIGLLQDYQARLLPVIERGGGSVDKFMGDGILVSFGAAEATGVECAQAVETGLAIIAEVELWKAGRRRAGLALIDAAVALSVGDVVYGAVGHGDRLEYTVIGDAVNLAAKLEKHAKTETARFLATAEVVAAAGAQGYPMRPLRKIKGATVDGVSEPIDLAILA